MALQLFKIAEVTVASPQANVEFTSIPQGYTDLVVKISARSSGGTGKARALQFKINSDTTYSNYTMVAVITNDTGSVTTAKFTSSTGLPFYLYGIPSADATANAFGTCEVYFPNYTSSAHKSFSAETMAESNDAAISGGTSYNGITAGLWSQTSAITGLSFNSDQSNLTTNSTFTLYGIL